MNFLIKRFVHGVIKRKAWLLLIIALPCLYLFFSSLRADRFTITQKLSIAENAPVSLVSSPVGHRQLSSIITNPNSFFQNSFTVNKLLQDITGTSTPDWSDNQSSELIQAIRNNMSISTIGKNLVEIKYSGKSQETGRVLVSYYSNRLIHQTVEGFTRSNTIAPKTPMLSGVIKVVPHRSVFRQDRISPLLQIIIFSSLGVLIMLGAMEWNDTSFKSERQIGRYLNLPVLGSVPDLNKLSSRIDSGMEMGSESPEPTP